MTLLAVLRDWLARVGARRGALRTLAAAGALLLALGAPGRVFAHAYLERSNPAGNTIVETAPGRVQLWFTERPELSFSDVTIYGSDGTRIPHGAVSLAPDSPRSIAFDLPAVPNGTYTVAWKTLSADDGHVAAGAFAFAVGLDQPAPTAASIFVPAGQAANTGRPNLMAVLGRWFAYAGAALVVGGPLFLALVLWPALRPARRASQPDSAPSLGPAVAARLSRLHWTGLGLVLLGLVAGLLGQAVAVGNDDPASLRAALLNLITTRSGLLAGCKLLAAGALALVILRYQRRGWVEQRRDLALPLALLGGLALLLAQSLGAHAAATAIWTSFTIGADLVHLLAMSSWLGGLALLVLVVPLVLLERPEHERTALLASIVGRFSPVAIWCVVALALSGLYAAWVQVGQVEGLTRTDYGVALLVKLALIVPLLLLGGFNLVVAKPGLARAAAVSARQARKSAALLARPLRLATRGEVLLGLAVLLVTGALTNLPPAREALVQLGRAQTRTAQADNLKLTLTVDPAVAGLNTYDLAVAGPSGAAVTDAERVALRFTHTVHDMGEVEVVLQPRGDGHYTAQGSYLSMAGLWNVSAQVRLPGRDDLTAAFEVPAGDPSALDAARANQVPSLGTTFLLGLELLVAALVLALGARRLRLPLRRPFNTLVPRLGAALIGAVGLYYLSIGIMNDLTPTAALANPIPPTRASIERGQEIYQQNCLACHGEYGRGDGPAGRVLRPRPADLQQHTTAHTEGQLYWWISKGFPGSAMPAWEDRLSEEDRWNVLNYVVQTFRPDATPSPAPAAP
jgi:copper transport protein